MLQGRYYYYSYFAGEKIQEVHFYKVIYRGSARASIHIQFCLIRSHFYCSTLLPLHCQIVLWKDNGDKRQQSEVAW